jgi:DNA-binding beta-propeller fold protein YncE
MTTTPARRRRVASAVVVLLAGGLVVANSSPASAHTDATIFAASQPSALTSVPRAIALSTDGALGYVVTDGGFEKINLHTSPPSVLGTTASIWGTSLALSADGKTAYVVDAVSGTLDVVDVSTNTPVLVTVMPAISPRNPSAVATSPDGKFVYLSYSGPGESGGVQVLSTSASRIPVAISSRPDNVLAGAPTDIAVTPDGRHVVTADTTNSTVTVIDTRTAASTDIDVPGQPGHVTISPDGRYAYVIGHLGSTVSSIDLLTDQVVRTSAQLDSDSGIAVAVSADGNYVYAATSTDSGSNSFYILDAHTFDVVEQLAGAEFPADIGVSAAGTNRGTAYLITSGDDVGSNPGAIYPLTQTPVGATPLALRATLATNPISSTVRHGNRLAVAVTTVGGTAPYRYSWTLNGQAIAGPTGAKLVISSATFAAGGIYAVRVSDSSGWVVSVARRITVAR